jgi:hypothetical protein
MTATLNDVTKTEESAGSRRRSSWSVAITFSDRFPAAETY